MQCPFCESDLIVSGQRQYQNLIEHVLMPNDAPSVKDIYTCSNNCPESQKFSFWDDLGDIYGGSYADYKDEKIKSAIGSINRKTDVENKISHILYNITKHLYKGNARFFVSYRWARWLINHGITLGYKL